MKPIKIQEQVDLNRRAVAFDSYDITVKQLYDMFLEGMVDIAPEYQRHFKWGTKRQSALIESLFLGIPIPSIFMATNKDASWEVVDGLQRITTIINFIKNTNDGVFHDKYNSDSFMRLKLSNLDILDSMNGLIFDELPRSLQVMFLTRPLKVTVLNDRSDYNVRYDLFERLNTGGVRLHAQEIRSCVFLGKFNDFLKELSVAEDFRAVVKMTAAAERSGSYEELVLRFFAYYENHDGFEHSVTGFLNDYMKQKTKEFKNESFLRELFSKTFSLLSEHLPNGIVRGVRKNLSSIVLYEAISVGVAMVIDKGSVVHPEVLEVLLNDSDLKKFTTGATNSKKSLLARINLVEKRLENGL